MTSPLMPSRHASATRGNQIATVFAPSAGRKHDIAARLRAFSSRAVTACRHTGRRSTCSQRDIATSVAGRCAHVKLDAAAGR